MSNSKKVDVILIVPPERRGSTRPPLGLMYISSFLQKEGFSNEIIDIKSKLSLEEVSKKIVERVNKVKPNYVGISCLTTELNSGLKISNEIKKTNPKLKIIMGGIHPTLFPDEVIKDDNVDIVVMGEGEITFSEILKKSDLKNIEGIYFKKDGEIIKNNLRKPITNLNSIPMPAFDKVSMKYYLDVSGYVIRGVPTRGFYIFTSRGCSYRCEFCVNKNIFGRVIRFRSAKNVVDEIEYLKEKYQLDSFFIYDDTFTASKDHVLSICQEMKNRKINLIWGCETRVNLLDDELVKVMRDAGCIQIDFGMESGSQRLLDLIKKDITIKQIKKAVALCKKYKIRIFSNFMVNLPTETKKDLNMTINLAKELKSDITVFNITTPFPGSDMFKNSECQLSNRDYKKLTTSTSMEEYVNFIEEKFRISEHKIPINKILSRIALNFPHSGNFKPKLNKVYLANLLRYFSFLKDTKYLASLFRTKYKTKYFSYIKNIFKGNL